MKIARRARDSRTHWLAAFATKVSGGGRLLHLDLIRLIHALTASTLVLEERAGSLTAEVFRILRGLRSVMTLEAVFVAFGAVTSQRRTRRCAAFLVAASSLVLLLGIGGPTSHANVLGAQGLAALLLRRAQGISLAEGNPIALVAGHARTKLIATFEVRRCHVVEVIRVRLVAMATFPASASWSAALLVGAALHFEVLRLWRPALL
mmetsp:Transcript_8791/g.19521  ORF Transcript_8791/g.19521 Transcript_8791/m.19521 type:complete len:206 (+) Transcript_8791:596-1213(+)